MNHFDDYIRTSISQEDIPMPENFHARTQDTLDNLPIRMSTSRRRTMPRLVSAAACFFFAFFLLLPNVSPAYAKTMAQVPVIGALVEVFTIRNYSYADELHELEANVPSVSVPGNDQAGARINKSAAELIDAVVADFYAQLEDGPSSVHVDYEAVTNTEDWFTLKLIINEVEASGYTRLKFYHIDRSTGNYVTLGDLFDAEGLSFLAQQVRSQMDAAMAADENAAYFPEEAEPLVTPQQNFYFTANGDLVLVYDEYTIAPGSMGTPEFKIPAELYRNYLAN